MNRQIIILSALLAFFIAFNYGIYSVFTYRYIDRSDFAAGHSINPEKYLPFYENSQIVKFNSELTLTENLPRLDGATAFLPVYSAFMNAIYPSGSSNYQNGNFTVDSLLQCRQTGGAYRAIVDGETDIIFVFGPSAEQAKYAADNDVELVYVPIGVEAFVFVVSANNVVTA